MEPLGFNHRHDTGLLGALARWWYQRRVRQIRYAQMRTALDTYTAEHPIRERP